MVIRTPEFLGILIVGMLGTQACMALQSFTLKRRLMDVSYRGGVKSLRLPVLVAHIIIYRRFQSHCEEEDMIK